MLTLDADGQPPVAINWHRNLLKSIENLLGLCQGLIADNHLSEQEIAFLDTWLKENQETTKAWPGDIIARRVREVLADGVVTAEEADDLRDTLQQIVSGVASEGIASGMAATLPIQKVHSILFEQSVFCFTGKFLYGSRRKVHRATEALGGICLDNVTTKLDYVVIGALASRDWAHTSFGRKIQRAVELRDKGYPIAIISEENWAQFI